MQVFFSYFSGNMFLMFLLKKKQKKKARKKKQKKKARAQAQDETIFSLTEWFVYLSFFLSVLLFVYCPLKGSMPCCLFCSRVAQHVQGFTVCIFDLWVLGAKHCSSHLCLSCFSSCSFQPVYSNIYLSCFIVSSGYRNMRLLLGCWKSSFQNPCIKCFASGCYNILRILHHIISQKRYYLLWRLLSKGWIMLLYLLMFLVMFFFNIYLFGLTARISFWQTTFTIFI